MDVFKEFFSNFSPLSEKSASDFKSIFHQKLYKKKEILIKAGEIHHKVYILYGGVVRAYVENENGKENVRSFFTPISAFTSIPSVIDNAPSHSHFSCLTDVQLYQASYSDFKELVKKNHEIAILYTEILEEILSKMINRINALTSLDATEHYNEIKKNTPNIEQLIPLYQIASYLNITPIQLSRIRKKLYSK